MEEKRIYKGGWFWGESWNSYKRCMRKGEYEASATGTLWKSHAKLLVLCNSCISLLENFHVRTNEGFSALEFSVCNCLCGVPWVNPMGSLVPFLFYLFFFLFILFIHVFFYLWSFLYLVTFSWCFNIFYVLYYIILF